MQFIYSYHPQYRLLSRYYAAADMRYLDVSFPGKMHHCAAPTRRRIVQVAMRHAKKRRHAIDISSRERQPRWPAEFGATRPAAFVDAEAPASAR